MARLLYEYPEVFDAYRSRVFERHAGKAGKGGSFLERRERSRDKRLARLANRK